MIRNRYISIAVMAGVLACASQAQAQSATSQPGEPASADKQDPGVWRLSTGINYSEGDYGDVVDTKVVSVPVALKYSRGGFSVRVSVPFVHIDGPGSLLDTPQGRDAGFGGSGGTDDSGSNSGSGSSGSNSGSGSSGSGSGSSGSGSGETVIVPVVPTPGSSRSGFGDMSVALGYSVPLGETTYLDLSARAKLPTASTAKRLGTGKVDLTLGGELAQDIGDLTLWAGARRKFVGKPVGSTLRDVWGAGGGASLRLARGTSVGVDYDWQQSTNPLRQASSEVTGWVNFRLTRKLRMQLYASTGFNTNSTDFAGGLSLSWRLN